MTRVLLLVILGAACQPVLQAAEAQCRTADLLRMRVRFAGEAVRDVLVQPTLPYGFRLLDAASRVEIWSAGPAAANTQQVPGMDAGFGASFAAVHLDADGVQDRLYAGDRSGRVWRFDLHAGARPGAWMQPILLADLGVPGGGRGFAAPPDITRIETSSGVPWLNIAIGTANTAAPRNDHRFYVLRDSLTNHPDTPLVEADLALLAPPAGITRGNARGYYLDLGSAQVLARALTLNGRIHFVVVESARSLLAGCGAGALPATPLALSVTVIRAQDGALEPDPDREAGDHGNSSGNLRRPLAEAQSASAGVELAMTQADASGRVPCLVGSEALPACLPRHATAAPLVATGDAD